MVNTSKLINLTNKIKKVYSRLYELEKSSQFNEEYNNLLDILNDLLIREDELYKKLTDEDINFLYEYISLRGENPSKNFGIFSYDFLNYANNFDLIYERINIRLGIYLRMDEIGDINWYKKIYRGIYLNDNSDINMESDYYLTFIQSSWAIINYIKNLNNSTYTDEYKLLMKYVNTFIEPFTEKLNVKNKFIINNDYGYILKINSYNNQYSSYMNAAITFYENGLEEFVLGIMDGSIDTVDGYFLDMITGIESFLEIIDDELRKYIYMDSISYYRYSNMGNNECTNYLLNLFDKDENISNKEYKNIKKEYK